jgi:hypothetical protein
MRTLKTIVATLGVLLVVGFGVLVYGLSQNWHRLSDAAAPAPAAPGASTPAPAAAPPANWGRVALGLTADSRIQSITPAGRVIVVQVVSGNDERLLVLDPASGAVVGTFTLTDRP